MNTHAWLVAATGLPEDSVWRAYQNSAHEPLPGADYVTYDEGTGTPQVFLSEQYDVPDEPAPVPESVTLVRQSVTPTTVTIRVFGDNRNDTAKEITQAGPKDGATKALAPAVFQRVVNGSYMPLRLQRERGWMEWIQFDVLILDSVTTTEVVPTIQGSVITGDIGDMPVEVLEP